MSNTVSLEIMGRSGDWQCKKLHGYIVNVLVYSERPVYSALSKLACCNFLYKEIRKVHELHYAIRTVVKVKVFDAYRVITLILAAMHMLTFFILIPCTINCNVLHFIGSLDYLTPFHLH